MMIVFAFDPWGRFSKPRKANPSEIKVEMMIDGEWREARPNVRATGGVPRAIRRPPRWVDADGNPVKPPTPEEPPSDN